MLNDEKLWFIEEDDLNKKAVSVEAGAKIISSDCWLFEDWIDRIDANGNPCGCYCEMRESKFEEIFIPNSVEVIEDSAFRNHKNLKKINVLENVTEIGKHAFAGCDNLGFVVAPLVNKKTVSDAESKIKLTTGYILNKELYSEEIAAEYEKYIKRQRAKIILNAQLLGLFEVAEKLD